MAQGDDPRAAMCFPDGVLGTATTDSVASTRPTAAKTIRADGCNVPACTSLVTRPESNGDQRFESE